MKNINVTKYEVYKKIRDFLPIQLEDENNLKLFLFSNKPCVELDIDNKFYKNLKELGIISKNIEVVLSPALQHAKMLLRFIIN